MYVWLLTHTHPLLVVNKGCGCTLRISHLPVSNYITTPFTIVLSQCSGVVYADRACCSRTLLSANVFTFCSMIGTLMSGVQYPHTPIMQAQETLDSSHREMNESFSSVFAFLHEQQQIIAEMFEEFNLVTGSLSFLLSIIQGKVSFLHSLLFFVVISTISYVATSFRYTQLARPFLYVLCTSNFLLEAVVVLYQQLLGSEGGVSQFFCKYLLLCMYCVLMPCCSVVVQCHQQYQLDRHECDLGASSPGRSWYIVTSISSHSPLPLYGLFLLAHLSPFYSRDTTPC